MPNDSKSLLFPKIMREVKRVKTEADLINTRLMDIKRNQENMNDAVKRLNFLIEGKDPDDGNDA